MSRGARRKRVARWLVLAAVAAGIVWLAAGRLDGPWGMVPGGRLRGASLPCPGSWERFATARELELEVRPERPRSVTTWSVVRGGELFVPADFLTPWKRWPQQVLEDGRVRLRLEARIFECRAERVADEALVESLRLAAAEKYGIRPARRSARVEVWWFRVGSR